MAFNIDAAVVAFVLFSAKVVLLKIRLDLLTSLFAVTSTVLAVTAAFFPTLCHVLAICL
jgi:hypothetical protein